MSSKEEREQEISFQNESIRLHNWKCCLNCDYGREGVKPCLKWKVEPPLEAIMVGCNSWESVLPF